MLLRARERISEEHGFTLIELLAVILIIGILAAIALPTFFVHRDRAEDADAKSAARNLSTEVESCYLTEQDYSHCNTAAQLGPGVTVGTNPGEAYVSASDISSYTVIGVSKGNLGGTHLFYVSRASPGAAPVHSCTPVGHGGCPSTGGW
jgi:type IV pilus assembly protein PilA